MIVNTDLVYPIGSIYLSVNATNPSKYFGGTWEQITSDAYLKIVSSGAGSLGGTSADHKIPLTSIPAHSHRGTARYDDTYNIGNAGYAAGSSGIAVVLGAAHVFSVASNGGGQAYYPYYYGVYVWKRVA